MFLVLLFFSTRGVWTISVGLLHCMKVYFFPLVCCVSTGSTLLKQQTLHAPCDKSIPSNIYQYNST